MNNLQCEICLQQVKVLTTIWGKRLCNSCLGSNYPRILSEHNAEIAELKKKLDIATSTLIKTDIELAKAQKQVTQRNKQVADLRGRLKEAEDRIKLIKHHHNLGWIKE